MFFLRAVTLTFWLIDIPTRLSANFRSGRFMHVGSAVSKKRYSSLSTCNSCVRTAVFNMPRYGTDVHDPKIPHLFLLPTSSQVCTYFFFPCCLFAVLYQYLVLSILYLVVSDTLWPVSLNLVPIMSAPEMSQKVARELVEAIADDHGYVPESIWKALNPEHRETLQRKMRKLENIAGTAISTFVTI